jgi:hypothetical protein
MFSNIRSSSFYKLAYRSDQGQEESRKEAVFQDRFGVKEGLNGKDKEYQGNEQEPLNKAKEYPQKPVNPAKIYPFHDVLQDKFKEFNRQKNREEEENKTQKLGDDPDAGHIPFADKNRGGTVQKKGGPQSQDTGGHGQEFLDKTTQGGTDSDDQDQYQKDYIDNLKTHGFPPKNP